MFDGRKFVCPFYVGFARSICKMRLCYLSCFSEASEWNGRFVVHLHSNLTTFQLLTIVPDKGENSKKFMVVGAMLLLCFSYFSLKDSKTFDD